MRNFLWMTIVVALLLAACARKQVEDVGKAPDVYRVQFDTTKGSFTVEVHKDWAPLGADRFYELAKKKFFDGNRFFRVLKGFVVQFGINGKPDVMDYWYQLRIPDDPVKQSNTRGTITFATSGPATRTTQVFINYDDNTKLDAQGFAPFGRVVQGMEVVDNLNGEYGEAPDQGKLRCRVTTTSQTTFRTWTTLRRRAFCSCLRQRFG
ncbi:MAG TPA: peptidylprolyl isomerase [Bryobacteraceae bacterium]|nr:peptidylprolyl isomerase [Bryobacteraceae bacterium]